MRPVGRSSACRRRSFGSGDFLGGQASLVAGWTVLLVAGDCGGCGRVTPLSVGARASARPVFGAAGVRQHRRYRLAVPGAGGRTEGPSPLTGRGVGAADRGLATGEQPSVVVVVGAVCTAAALISRQPTGPTAGARRPTAPACRWRWARACARRAADLPADVDPVTAGARRAGRWYWSPPHSRASRPRACSDRRRPRPLLGAACSTSPRRLVLAVRRVSRRGRLAASHLRRPCSWRAVLGERPHSIQRVGPVSLVGWYGRRGLSLDPLFRRTTESIVTAAKHASGHDVLCRVALRLMPLSMAAITSRPARRARPCPGRRISWCRR
jgi:hypothetical protein